MAVDVKICGLTNVDDARLALDAGADYLGFVLYPKSPRVVRPADLRRLRDALPDTARVVAVCVNMGRAEVERIAVECRLWAVQLHGDEAAPDFAGLPCRLWRAVRIEAGHWRPAPEGWGAERLVADACAPGRYGGTGARTDWTAAAELARRHATMLAGGITPDNVAAAVAHVRPLGVDVSSGVEASPGRKDPAKVRAFIANAKQHWLAT